MSRRTFGVCPGILRSRFVGSTQSTLEH
jgi:hypothetical protein